MIELESTGKPLIDDLRHWAAEHAEKSEGRMVVLDYHPNDKENFPGQKGASVTAKKRSDLGFIDMMADAASDQKFAAILEALETQADNSPHVDAIGEALAVGANVEMVTNHGELTDIAIAHAALYTVLHRRGHGHMQTGIVINKMIAFLGYEFFGDYIPCTKVLMNLENETFLSYPRTNSAREHLQTANENARSRLGIRGHNIHVRSRIDHKLGKGSLLLAMAASGSTDRPRRDNPSIIDMETVGSGTIDLMKKPHTLVAPFAVWFQSEQMVLRPIDTPRHVESADTVHGMMGDIADVLTDSVPEKTFSYQLT